MSILQQISKPADRPVVVTILGDSGMGKTSLAASFPKPLFIRGEDGLQAVPAESRPDALPLVESVDQLWDQFKAVITEEHDYKTIVVDSVTALERLFIQHVIDTDPKKPKSINTAMGGYGAGFNAVASMHQRVRRAAERMVQKGLNVVFVAHADVDQIDLPDEDPFSRYNLRLNKKSVAPYVDDSDVVGFIKLKTFTTGDGERKKAISDGSRVLVTYATAANVSKNRYGITEDLVVELGENPLVGYVPFLRGVK